VIEFLCPNGHRIRCSQDQAGRAAKCPRCGVKFRIPDSSQANLEAAAAGDSSISQPELTDSRIGETQPGGQPKPAANEPQIEFLCPNGHHLHGPAHLQGRPGECPECGSRFRIPTYDDVPEGEETELDISLGRSEHEEVGRPEHEKGAEPALPQIDVTAGESATWPRFGRTDAADQATAAHPLAALFSKLWAEKPPRAAVELHLANGETLVPDQFAQDLSQQSHGVFAVNESGGTHTLTVVAWESIVRVLIQGVKQLPKEMSG